MKKFKVIEPSRFLTPKELMNTRAGEAVCPDINSYSVCPDDNSYVTCTMYLIKPCSGYSTSCSESDTHYLCALGTHYWPCGSELRYTYIPG